MARAVLRRVRGVTSATIRASKTRNWPTIVNHWPPGSNNAGLISLSDFERRSAFHQARPQLPPPAILLRLLCTVVVQVRAWVDKRVHRVTRWTRVNPLFAVDTSNGMEKHRDPTLLRARDRSASNYIFMGDLDRSIVLSSCSYTRQRFSRRSPFSLASVYGDLWLFVSASSPCIFFVSCFPFRLAWVCARFCWILWLGLICM